MAYRQRLDPCLNQRFANTAQRTCRDVRNDPGLLVTGRGRFGAFGTRSGELNGGTTNRWSPDASDHEVAKKMTEYVEALSESDRAEVAQQTLKRCGMASSKGRA